MNNMPEAAFEETHREFTRLVHASSKAQEVELRCYRMPAVHQGSPLSVRSPQCTKISRGSIGTHPTHWS